MHADLLRWVLFALFAAASAGCALARAPFRPSFGLCWSPRAQIPVQRQQIKSMAATTATGQFANGAKSHGSVPIIQRLRRRSMKTTVSGQQLEIRVLQFSSVLLPAIVCCATRNSSHHCYYATATSTSTHCHPDLVALEEQMLALSHFVLCSDVAIGL